MYKFDITKSDKQIIIS